MSWMAIIDLWVIEHGQQAGFLLKARLPRRIPGEVRGQDLQRNIASAVAVASAVGLTHAASAQRRENFVRSEMSTRIQANGETPCPDRRKWRRSRAAAGIVGTAGPTLGFKGCLVGCLRALC